MLSILMFRAPTRELEKEKDPVQNRNNKNVRMHKTRHWHTPNTHTDGLSLSVMNFGRTIRLRSWNVRQYGFTGIISVQDTSFSSFFIVNHKVQGNLGFV